MFVLAVSSAAQQPAIPVWPGGTPGTETWKQKEVEFRNPQNQIAIRNVVNPTLTPFLPDAGNANGTAVIVCPGGGFRFLSWESEGTEVAKWLAARGIAAFVLKYRLIDTGATEEEFRHALATLFASIRKMSEGLGGRFPALEDLRAITTLAAADAGQAVRLVRQRASEWKIRPDRIGLLGFSAGAMVTMGVVMENDAASKLNFAAPIYGGATNGQKVPEDAPPLFLLAAQDDPLSVTTVQLYSDWKAAGRPAELHIYSKGGHGFGMNKRNAPVDTWIERFGDWLAQFASAR